MWSHSSFPAWIRRVMGWQGWGQALEGKETGTVWENIVLGLNSADKSVPFAFLLCHVLLGRCQGPQAWSGAGLGRLSMAPLTAGSPASTHSLAILGSWSIAYIWGNFPSVISFIIASPSVLSASSRIPNGSLLPSGFIPHFSSLISSYSSFPPFPLSLRQSLTHTDLPND